MLPPLVVEAFLLLQHRVTEAARKNSRSPISAPSGSQGRVVDKHQSWLR